MKRFVYPLFAVIGLLCVLFPAYVTSGLPYVLGGAMALGGAAYGISYFRDRDAWADRSSELGSGMVLFVVGVLCIFHGKDSIVPLGTTWAVIGLRKAAKSLSRAVQSRGKGVGRYVFLAEFLVRLAFSVALLFYPAEKFETHVILLGLQLIVTSIRFTRRRNSPKAG